MSRTAKTIIAGSLIAVLGMIMSLLPLGARMEENVGLHILFALRGAQMPPHQVLIVTIDKESADQLGLPRDPRKWPRSIHARLIEQLTRESVAFIAFDIIFNNPGTEKDNQRFAEAIRSAGNILLVDLLKIDKVILPGKQGSLSGELGIERIIPPIPILEEASVATAPFVLPKIPFKINSYYAFKANAGNIPTLPVVAFQYYALSAYENVHQRLKDHGFAPVLHLPEKKEMVLRGRCLKDVVGQFRSFFEQHPISSDRAIASLEQAANFTAEASAQRSLEMSLMRMYQGPDLRYLNYYGPPGSIETISYYQIMGRKGTDLGHIVKSGLKGKAVFVGLSGNLQLEHKEGFYTVFSQSDGQDISGVEIAATAFANLLEDRPLRPLKSWAFLGLICCWGMLIGGICAYLSGFYAFGCALLICLGYLAASWYRFAGQAHWLPVFIPLLIQAPAAVLGNLIWKYVDINRERKNIRYAFKYYLPDPVVDRLSKSVANLSSSHQNVYSTCLLTDAEKYTAVSENMAPERLTDLLNHYFEALFEPVRHHEGLVSDVKGDSMLAIWPAAIPKKSIREKTCQTALDIVQAVERFNLNQNEFCLPTRIGLHSGYISLGNIGAINHYEYRPIGDIVNTTSRLESLNKLFQTKILTSKEIVDDLEDFLVRNLGNFILPGKSKPIQVHQLVSRLDEDCQKEQKICDIFARGLEAYHRRFWSAAAVLFETLLRIQPDDGPALFYLNRCKAYCITPPGLDWDNTIHL
jgi:adenylate cyclase